MFYWGAGQSNDLQTAYHGCAYFHFLFVARILLCPKVSSIKNFLVNFRYVENNDIFQLVYQKTITIFFP